MFRLSENKYDGCFEFDAPDACYYNIRSSEALGNEAMARQAAYQELFHFELSSLVNEIRQATNGGYVFVRCKFQR